MSSPAVSFGASNRLHRLRDAAERFVAVAVSLLLAVLVVLATAETAAWALFDVAWAAGEEVQSVLLVWLALLAAAWGVAARLHLGIDMVARRLPPPLARATARLAAAAVALFGLLLAVHGGRLAATVVNTLPATGWSAAVSYVPAVVGGGLIAFFAVLEAVLADLVAESP